MSEDTKQVIVIRRDLAMRRGKEIAQGAHASMAFLTRLWPTNPAEHYPAVVDEWIQDSFRKITVTVPDEDTLLEVYQQALQAGVIASLIEDEGKTEFGGVPTHTAVAVGPDYDSKIDPITGHLPLY